MQLNYPLQAPILEAWSLACVMILKALAPSGGGAWMAQEVTKGGPGTSLLQPMFSLVAAVEQVTVAHYCATD